ncbi:MAG: DASS family sodium-coupled anion symporter [Negativicutes bacterium]|nr:DASS family sodium-coupled anion symporter [Negativicutes bacterium]
MSTQPGEKSGFNPGRLMENLRQKWGLPLAIACMLAVWFAPTPVGLTLVGKKALSIFAGIFVLYMTEAMPLAVTSLAIIPLMVLTGTVKLAGVLEGFAAPTVFLLIGAFILGIAMVNTKLADRITYIILTKIGSKTRNIVYGVMAVNVVLAFLVPSATARTAILIPICLGIIHVFEEGNEGRSPFVVALLITMCFTNVTISAGIMTATVANPVVIEFIAKGGGPAITYMQWLILGFPPAILMTVLTAWYVLRVFPPERDELPGGQQYVEDKLKSFGPMSSEEKRTLSVFLVVVTMWVLGDWIKVDPTTACMVGAVALYLPKFGVLKWSDAHKGVPWAVALITGGGIALGDILMKTGAAKWLATTIFSLLGLQSLSTLMLLVAVMLVCVYLHFFFVGTTPMATALLPIILSIASTAGIPPVVLALPAGMIIGGYALLMFYCTNPSILVYSTGRVRIEDYPRAGIPLSAIACIVYALCAATYWRWLGFF